MEITLATIEERRKQINAEVERLVAEINFRRGVLSELDGMEARLKAEEVPEGAPV